MAERKEITVKAAPRDGRGKNDARRARRNGQVPVTIYGGEVSALRPELGPTASDCRIRVAGDHAMLAFVDGECHGDLLSGGC